MSEALQPGETVIARFRPGLIGALTEALPTVIFFPLALLAAYRFTTWFEGVAPASLALQAALFAIFFPAMMAALAWSDRWVLTDRRLIDTRRGRELALDSLHPVRWRWWGGLIVVSRAGGSFRLRALPAPAEAARQIEAARLSREARHE